METQKPEFPGCEPTSSKSRTSRWLHRSSPDFCWQRREYDLLVQKIEIFPASQLKHICVLFKVFNLVKELFFKT